MEVVSFTVGLSGLLAVVDKVFLLWQSIEEAKAFGKDMMGLAAQLSWEYYRFRLWSKVSGIAEASKQDTSGSTSADEELNNEFLSLVENSVARIQAILEEIREIVSKYDNLMGDKTSSWDIFRPGPGQTGSTSSAVAVNLSTAGFTPNISVQSKQESHKAFASSLQKIPFRLRFKFSMRPWSESDKKALTAKIMELGVWNERLERPFPRSIKKSIQQQAKPASMLVEDYKDILASLSISNDQNEAVKTHARLWLEKLRYQEFKRPGQDQFQNFRYDGPLSLSGETQSTASDVSLVTFQPNQTSSTRVLIERYSYGARWSNDDKKLAISRIEELVHLSAMSDRPESLRILQGICFVERLNVICVVRHVPEPANPFKSPISLYSLLHNVPEAISGFRSPALEERIKLAQQVAASVYSFGIVRWYHKDFNCKNIIFFRDKSPSARLMLDSPYVTGLSIARPEADGTSLNKDIDELNIYLHPDLRVTTNQRPRYHRKYDIYSLGLTLLEIGLWQPIDRLHKYKQSLDAQQLKDLVIDRCKKDLPFYAGTRYTNAVLYCLMCADEEESASSIDALYEFVLLELAKCQ